MAEVNVSVNGATYRLSCEDGQQQRVVMLARMVDAKIDQMGKSARGANDSRLLMMAALQLADEVLELRALKGEERRPNGSATDTPAPAPDVAALRAVIEAELAETMNEAADKVEYLCEKLAKLLPPEEKSA